MKINKKELQELIVEETQKILAEGLLEDPIAQADSLILNTLNGRGFKTRGFIEEIVASIEQTAKRDGLKPIEVAEDEISRMRDGLDDLMDRIQGRLMTYFPRGVAYAYATKEQEPQA